MHISICLVGCGKTPPVQVAVGGGSMVASHVCTLNVLVVIQEKHHLHKLQVMPTASASEVFVLNDSRKNTAIASCRGSRSSWTLVEIGCSNQL